MLINVGSVGQPRDGDPRAAYGLLDLEQGRIRLRRVAYDVEAAQAPSSRPGCRRGWRCGSSAGSRKGRA